VKHISRYSGNFSAPLSVATPVNASMWKLARTISDQPRVSRKSGLGRLSEFFFATELFSAQRDGCDLLATPNAHSTSFAALEHHYTGCRENY